MKSIFVAAMMLLSIGSATASTFLMTSTDGRDVSFQSRFPTMNACLSEMNARNTMAGKTVVRCMMVSGDNGYYQNRPSHYAEKARQMAEDNRIRRAYEQGYARGKSHR